jgi:tryptophanase
VADVCIRVKEQRDTLRGLKILHAPEFLRHFVAEFEPV